ncbi:transposase family protein [Streptomyces sp. NPDC002835]
MTKTKEHAGDTVSLVYQCRLPLSTHTLNYLTDLLRRHLKAIRSRWRALPPGRIAVIVLAVLRHDQRLADMAGGSDISATTIRRWRDELIHLLAAKAPRLDRALKTIARRGGEVVLIDDTLIPTQRRTGEANRPNHSGKHRRHGLHVLALPDERGRLVWISAARPGRTHDITAARRDRILAHCVLPTSAPRPTWASSAWTTTGTFPWSSPAPRPPAPAGSHPPRRRPTGSWPPDASPSNAALPT